MVGVLKLASATDRISDAAGDLAILTLLNMPLHDSVRAALIGGEEVVSRIKIREGSVIANKTIGKVFSQLNIALDIIAARKGHTWTFSPLENYVLETGDVMIVRGPKEAVDKLRHEAKDKITREEKIESFERTEEEIAKELIALKDLGEFMLDLAYLAITTNNRDLALEVIELEEYIDQTHIDLERKVIMKLKDANPDEIVTILRTIISFENIADAAAEIAGIVISEIPPHPILKTVIEESEEKVVIVQVSEDLEGKKIDDLNLSLHGAVIVALRRNHEWILNPSDDTILKRGDKLIVRFYKESSEQVRKALKIDEELWEKIA